MGIPTSSISISFLTQSILRLLGSFPVFLTQSWNFSFKHDAPQKNPNGIWLKRTLNMNLIFTALIFKSRNNHKRIGMTMNTSKTTRCPPSGMLSYVK
jgi:hypothetical protein